MMKLAGAVNDACFFPLRNRRPEIMRNMRSLPGIHLEEHVKKGLLMFHSSRPTRYAWSGDAPRVDA